MSTDPYAAPSSNLDTDAPTTPTSIWTAKGRLSVLSYLGQSFLLLLAVMVITLVIGAIVAALGGGMGALSGIDSAPDFSNPAVLIAAALFIPLFLIFMYIGFCLMIKRLHDRNHSGWWSLALFIVGLIPIVGLISLIGYIYVFFFPGQKHSNNYGGPRPTKGWEKVLGVLYILFIVVAIGAGIAVPMMGLA